MEWFMAPLKKYATFSGRARRKEYWIFSLAINIFSGIFYSIAMQKINSQQSATVWLVIYSIIVLATFLPLLAVSVRRMHDVGKSGFYLFMGLIPIVGAILILIKTLTDSQPGTNEYGPNPKENA